MLKSNRSLYSIYATSDRIQMSDKKFWDELALRVHSNKSHSNDGISGRPFGFSDI